MPKAKRGLLPVLGALKRGAPDHFTGLIEQFLLSKAQLYQDAMDTKTVSVFYNNVAISFKENFGLEEPYNKGVTDVVLDPGLPVPASTPLTTADEAALFVKLRNKLSQWYRRKCRRPEASIPSKNKGSSTADPSANLYLSVLDGQGSSKPRRLTAVHQYQKTYYHERIKSLYIMRFEAAKLQHKMDVEAATEEERESLKGPSAVAMRSAIAMELWLLETKEFRDEVAEEAEAAYQAALEAWQASKKIPYSPQHFHQQLSYMGDYLYPVANAIAERMQAAVSICVIGPIAAKNGAVEVRSVHVNWPGGFDGATWPQHDKDGYRKAEESMASYGQANFSAEECQRRALPKEDNDNQALVYDADVESLNDSMTLAEGNASSSRLTQAPERPPALTPAVPFPSGLAAKIKKSFNSGDPALRVLQSSTPPSEGSLPSSPSTPPSVGTIPSLPSMPPSKGSLPSSPSTPPVGTIPSLPSIPSSKGSLPSSPSTPPSVGTIPSLPFMPPSVGCPPPSPSTARAIALSPQVTTPSPPQVASTPLSPRAIMPQLSSRVTTPPSLRAPTLPLPCVVTPLLLQAVPPPRVDTSAFVTTPLPSPGVATSPSQVATPLSPQVAPQLMLGLPRVSPQVTTPLSETCPVTKPLPTTMTSDPSMPSIGGSMPPVLTVPPVSTDWPEHMVNSYCYLTGQAESTKDEADGMASDWGDSWGACLKSYIEFQRRARFPEAGPSFPSATKIRPPEITNWMKNGRPRKAIDIKNIEVFRRQWQNWWLSLQPKSRKQVSNPPSTDMDWSDLRKPGKNGFLLIMVSLMWWGKNSDRDWQWLDAVVDVTQVLTCLNAPGPDTARPKRQRADTARPDTARPDTARPDTARPDTARPPSKRQRKNTKRKDGI